MIGRIRFATQLILSFRIVVFRRKGENVSRFGEKQPIQNCLTQFISFLAERVLTGAITCEQESGRNKQHNKRNKLRKRRLRETFCHQNQEQRNQCRQEPGNQFTGSGKINQQYHPEAEDC